MSTTDTEILKGAIELLAAKDTEIAELKELVRYLQKEIWEISNHTHRFNSDY